MVRDIVVPAIAKEDEKLRQELGQPVPLQRLVKLREVRSLIDLSPALRRPTPPPDLSRFDAAIRLAARTVDSWGGRLIVVILPNYGVALGGRNARYDEVVDVLNAAPVEVVNGVALFAAQPDVRSLYTLRIDNHPSEKGHALLANAILTALRHEEAK